MQTRARLRLSEPDPSNDHINDATTSDDDEGAASDAAAGDDEDLEHLPLERRIQLAMAAVQTGVMSDRKAALYYRAPHTTIQRRIKGVLPRREAHAHERSLTNPQEEVLAEWIKVRT
jgi:hypothetical protein